MNKLNKQFLSTVIFISVTLFNVNASAKEALSKAFIQQYAKATEQLAPLIEASPKIEDQLAEAMMQGKPAMLKLVKSLAIYPDIKSKVTNAGFNNVEHYIDTSIRLIGAVISSQTKQQFGDVNVDEFIKNMENQISAIKKQGLPKEMLSLMEGNITKQLHSMKAMQQMTKNASEADVNFITDNLAWVMQMIPNIE